MAPGPPERVALQQWAERNSWTFTPKEPQLSRQWQEHPIRGAGSATTILRGTVPEGEIVAFTNYMAVAGNSTARPSLIGVIDIGAPLPTTVAASPAAKLTQPGPPELLDLGDPQFAWSLFTYSPEDAAAAARLFTPQVRNRLTHEEESSPLIELTFAGQELLVRTPGPLGINRLERRIDLLRDLGRMLRSS